MSSKSNRGRILVINDDPPERKAITNMLVPEGYLVVAPATANEVRSELNLIKQNAFSFDVIILDYFFSHSNFQELGDGVAVVHDLRSFGTHPPILLATQYRPDLSHISWENVYLINTSLTHKDQLVSQIKQLIGRNQRNVRDIGN